MACGLFLLMGWMLFRAPVVMDAVSSACRLFVTGVLPGLLPYMVLAQLALCRIAQPVHPAVLMLLGWGGGSPTGALLLRRAAYLPAAQHRRIAVACATMSPMFLAGTLGQWLQSPAAGACILLSVLLSGWLAARFASGRTGAAQPASAPAAETMTFGQAVEHTARTLLTVCGTMAVMRALAALLCEALTAQPWAALLLTTLLEVTTGAVQIAALPLPLALRTALLAGVTGFGGAAIIMQNRTFLPPGLLTLMAQVGFQALHAVLAFLLALGMALMSGL